MTSQSQILPVKDDWLEIYSSKFNVFSGENFSVDQIQVIGSILKYVDKKKNIEYTSSVLYDVVRYTNITNLNKEFYKFELRSLNDDTCIYNLEVLFYANMSKIEQQVISKGDIPNKESFFRFLQYTYKTCEARLNDMMNKAMKPAIYNNTNFQYPKEIKTKLYIYQRENIKWMLDIEKNISTQKLSFSQPNVFKYKNLYIDVRHKVIYFKNNKSAISFFGGVLADQVGLGKCVSSQTQIYINRHLEKIEDIYNNYSDKSTEVFDGEGYWYTPKQQLIVNSLNENTNKIIMTNVNKIYRQKVKTKLKKIILANGNTVTVTYSHKLLTNNGWKESKNIYVGNSIYVSKVLKSNNNEVYYAKIKSIKDVDYDDWVYDLEIKKHHNFVANGIICHNTLSSITLSLMNPAPKSILDSLPTPKINYQDENKKWLCRAVLNSGKNKGKMCSRKVADESGNVKEKKYCKRHCKNLTVVDKTGKRDYVKIPQIKEKLFRKVNSTDYTHINTSATLIISPNQLCEQWKNEIHKNVGSDLKVYLIITKPVFEKIRYSDIIDADFVIVSFNFMVNPCHRNKWLYHKFSTGKYYHNTSDKIKQMSIDKLKNENILNDMGPIIPLFWWHRIMIDEFHELGNYNYELQPLIQNLKSTYRWGISGTPFASGQEGYKNIIRFITNSTDDHPNHPQIHNYITSKLFRRNTKESIKNEFTLPPIVEENIWLNFSDVETAMYKHKISINTDSNMRDIYLRQLCCHPNIAAATKEILNKCKTLDEVKEAMITENQEKINQLKRKISIKILHQKKIKKELNYAEKNKGSISDDALAEIKYRMRTINRLLPRMKKELEGHEAGLKYFTQIIPKLEECSLDECPICLCEIDDTDIGMTICAHFYCYEECLKDIIRTTGKCAMCNRVLGPDDAFLVQKEALQQPKKKSKEDEQLEKLINKYGTKCSHLIIDLKKILSQTNEHMIIFSQWDTMLTEIANILRAHKIKCLPCKGSIYQKNKAIRLFNSDEDYRIILLSTEYSAAGINLTKASTIIFIDPVYGSEQYRLSVECQAVGRAARLGQTKPVKIIRYLIKDSVEEDIFKSSYKTKLDINKLGEIKF